MPSSSSFGETRRAHFILPVAQHLLFVHGNEVAVHRASRQLSIYLLLAPAQHDGLQTFMQPVQIPVANGATLFVQLVEVAVEAE